jgi:HEAT repeat protein
MSAPQAALADTTDLTDVNDKGRLSRAEAIARHFNDMTRSAVAGERLLAARSAPSLAARSVEVSAPGGPKSIDRAMTIQGDANV